LIAKPLMSELKLRPTKQRVRNHKTESPNHKVARAARWTGLAGVMPSDNNTPRPDANADANEGASPQRQKLTALRHALLLIHKTLLNMERRDYEREHGAVNTGELFRLVIDDPQFAWLHNISEFVVRIDETLAGKEPVTVEYMRESFVLARKMFTPTESGDAFQKKYFDAIQREPAVVMDHADLARLFNTEPAEASAT
jgi:hypothetical protein